MRETAFSIRTDQQLVLVYPVSLETVVNTKESRAARVSVIILRSVSSYL
jgi:hypothetical protein